MNSKSSPANKSLTKGILPFVVFLCLLLLPLLFTACPEPIDQKLFLEVEDSFAPVITIISPADNSYYNSTISFELEITDDSLEEEDGLGSLETISYEIAGDNKRGGRITIADDGTATKDVEFGPGDIVYDSETGTVTFEFSTLESVEGEALTSQLKDLVQVAITAKDANGNSTEADITLRESNGLYVKLKNPGAISDVDDPDYPGTVNFVLYDRIPVSGTILDTIDSTTSSNEIKSIAWSVSGQTWRGYLDLVNAVESTDMNEWLDQSLDVLPGTFIIPSTGVYISENRGTTRGFNYEFTYDPRTMIFETEVFAAKSPAVIIFDLQVTDLNGHITSVGYSLPLNAEGPETIVTQPDLSSSSAIFFSKTNYANGPLYIEGAVTNLSNIRSFAYYVRSNKNEDDAPDIVVLQMNDIFEDVDGVDTFKFLINGDTTGSLDPIINDAAFISTINGWVGSIMTITLIVTGTDDLETRPLFSAVLDGEGPTVSLADNLGSSGLPQESGSGKYLLTSGDVVNITATFEDDAGIFEINQPAIIIGSLDSVDMSRTNNLIWNYSWTVPDGNDGAADIVIDAYDSVGNPNSAPTGVTGYIIDNTAPEVVLATEEGADESDNIVRDADTLTITATFSDLIDTLDTSVTPKIQFSTTPAVDDEMVMSSDLVWTYNWDVPSGNDGDITPIIVAQDRVGNVVEVAGTIGDVEYRIDNTAPAGSQTVDIPSSTTGFLGYRYIGTDLESNGFDVNVAIVLEEVEAGDELQLLLDGFEHATDPHFKVLDESDLGADDIVFTIDSDWMGTSDGSKSFTARIIDQAGNTGDECVPFVVILDRVKPDVELLDNHDENERQVNSGDVFNLIAEFSDTNSINEDTPPRIEINTLTPINAVMTKDGTDNKRWYYPWTVPTDASNVVDITITATDAAGNPNTAVEPASGFYTSYHIDNLAPSVSLSIDSDPRLRRVKEGDVVNFTATFVENEDEISEEDDAPRLQIPALDVPWDVAMERTSNTVWTYSWTVPDDDANDKAVSIFVEGYDRAGNENTPVTVENAFTIDNIAPVEMDLYDGASSASSTGYWVNDVQEAAGFTVTVPLESDAITGDLLELFLDGSDFPTELETELDAADISAGSVDFTIASHQLGSDSPLGTDKSITAQLTDIVGNVGAVGSALEIRLDTVDPTVSVSDDHDEDEQQVNSGDVFTITATFVDVNDIVAPYIAINSDTAVNAAMTEDSEDNRIWTYEWTVPDGNDKNVSISISAEDAAGNPNEAVTAGSGGYITYLIDNEHPEVAVTAEEDSSGTTDSIVRDTNTVLFSTAFTETIDQIDETSVPQIEITDVDSTKTYNLLKADNLNWYYSWDVPSGSEYDGSVTVTIVADDRAGNEVDGITGDLTFTIDNTAPDAPAVTDFTDNTGISGDRITNDSTVEITGTAEAASVIEVDGTEVGTTDGAGDWTSSTISLSEGDNTLSITSTDTAGNESSALGYTIKLDTENPSAVLTAGGGDIYVRDDDVTETITVTLTEVRDLIDEDTPPKITIADYGITNAVMTEYNDSNNVWFYDWTLPSDNDLSVDVSVTATDRAGNSLASTSGDTNFIVDNEAPTVVITNDGGDSFVRSADTERITATFTENDEIDVNSPPEITIAAYDSVSEITSVMQQLDGGNTKVWYYDWVNPAGDSLNVSIIVSAVDRAGNTVTDSTSLNVDNTAPYISIAPAYDSTGLHGIDSNSTFGCSFSVDDYDYTADGDITVSLEINDVTQSATNTGGSVSSNYTVVEGQTDRTDEEIPIEIILTDEAGNSYTYNTPVDYLLSPDIDAHRPTVSFETISGTIVYEGALTKSITVTYSEDMDNATEPDISLSPDTNWGITAYNALNWITTTQYQVTATHNGSEEESGPVSVSVGISGATDLAGNIASSGADYDPAFMIDTEKPTLTITSQQSTPTNEPATLSFDFDFSESVNGFTVADISVNNGTLGGFSGSGDSYSVDVTGFSDGDVTVSVSSGTYEDDAQNVNSDNPSASVFSDRTAPVINGIADDDLYTQSKTWDWSTSSDGTGVGGVTYRYEVETTGTSGGSWSSYDLTTTATQGSGTGTYYLHVQAKDSLGN
ncbi:MAG: hypothetical protein JEY99_11665, partial [Spirochaetales bacterium]|nr:hypothetical protein [Spirochaetales bacterium]